MLAGLISIAPGMAQHQPAAATPQRPTFTSDTSTTAPGTLELEFGATTGDGFWQAPATIKFGAFTNSEFRLAFDAIDFTNANGQTVRRFGDRLVLGYRQRLYRRGRFSFALSPRLAALLRGNRGIRAGLAGIVAQEFGRNTLVVNLAGSGATRPGPNNPQRFVEFDTDLSRPLGRTGVRSRLGVFAGAHADKGKDRKALYALGQGITYRLRPGIVLDTAVRQVGLGSGKVDHQLLFGMTANLGRLGWR